MSEERENVWRETWIALLKSVLTVVILAAIVLFVGFVSALFTDAVQ